MHEPIELVFASILAFLVATPFALVVWMSVSLGHLGRRLYGCSFFIVTVGLLALMMISDLMEAWRLAKEGMPTGATLTAMASIAKCWGVVVVALVIRCRLGTTTKHRPAK